MPRFITDAPERSHHGRNFRRKHLIDRRLQGLLLVALVLLEVGLLAGATLYLYLKFSAIIDANLFTIHRSDQHALLPAFLKEVGMVVMVMSVFNTLALLAAHKLWVRYIQRVTATFRKRLERIGELDLGFYPDRGGLGHEVLDQLEKWRQLESDRINRLGLELELVPEATEKGYTESQRDLIRRQMVRCRQVLDVGT